MKAQTTSLRTKTYYNNTKDKYTKLEKDVGHIL